MENFKSSLGFLELFILDLRAGIGQTDRWANRETDRHTGGV